MSNGAPECFVVMGYKKRTDPDSSKVYDLDKSYRSIIKQAVEDAGFKPIRSDEVTEPGMISRQMYQLLMNADLVVCDLTTLNPNALFELGVRMALRPKATVVIAAEGTKIPFNLNQNRFFMYTHGGEVIDYEDAKAAQKRLTEACLAAKASTAPDSLIYSLFHRELQPPSWIADAARSPAAAVEPPVANEPAAKIRDSIANLKKTKQWTGAVEKLRELHADASAQNRPIESWFTQQWALCTYKQSEKGDQVDAQHLLQARDILRRLDPGKTTDAETLGIWAAVHKRLSEHPDRNAKSRGADLATAIVSYRKGYILRDDHYNGVNYAFLLLRRAVELAAKDAQRATRDIVEATDAWNRVVELCAGGLDQAMPSAADVQLEEAREAVAERFWQTASVAQSYLGLGDTDGYSAAWEQLDALEASLQEDWMVATTKKQESALKTLLEACSGLAFEPIVRRT